MTTDHDTVAVFPISSHTYSLLEKHKDPNKPVEIPDRRPPGFPDHRYTGIPALTQWLGGVAITARHEHMKELLDKLLGLKDCMQSWVSQDYTGTHQQRDELLQTPSDLEHTVGDGSYSERYG